VLDALADPLFTLDPSFYFRYVNPAFEAASGFSAKELLGKTLWECFPALVGTWFAAEYQRAMLDRVAVSFDCPNPRHNRWFEVRIYPMEGGLVVSLREIASFCRPAAPSPPAGLPVVASRRADALVETPRNLLEMIASDAPLRPVLEAIARFCDAQAPELLAVIHAISADRESLGPAVAPRVPQCPALILGHTPIGHESGVFGAAVHLRRPVISEDIAADPRWSAWWREHALASGLASAVAWPLFAPSGEVVGVFGAFGRSARPPSPAEDAAIRAAAHLAEVALSRRRREDELRLLREAVRRTQDMVTITDAQPMSRGGPRVIFVNDAFERITGWRREEVIGKPAHFVSDAAPSAEDFARRRADLSALRATSGEATRLGRDGREIWIESVVVPMASEDGQVSYWVAVERDVTAIKLSEQRAFEAQKLVAMGRLAGSVTHDFNNMLTVVQSVASQVASDLPEGDAHHADMDEIARAVGHCAALTRQILSMSRRHALLRQVLDVNDVAREVEGMLHRLLGEHIARTFVLAPGLWRVKADREQIAQVILNLAVNARDAMSRGGTLRIETANATIDEAAAREQVGLAPGRYVRLSVRDTGTGMSREVRDRIFEPFFTTKGVGVGTGLGLSTVYGVVEQSGGWIEVDSAPGQGSTFIIYLPATDEHEAAAPPERRRAAVRGSETVLLVEDDVYVREIASRGLERRGYTVVAVESGEDALAAAAGRSGPLHLLITDVVLPRMSGQAIAARLEQRYPGLCVLFISGYAEEDPGPRGPLDPGAALLEKPFTIDELAARARALLDARRGRAD
jgi:PAS domain S-box-containing protein